MKKLIITFITVMLFASIFMIHDMYMSGNEVVPSIQITTDEITVLQPDQEIKPCPALAGYKVKYKKIVEEENHNYLNNYLNLFVKTPDDVVILIENLTDNDEIIRFTEVNKDPLFWILKASIIEHINKTSTGLNRLNLNRSDFTTAVDIVQTERNQNPIVNVFVSGYRNYSDNEAYNLYKKVTESRDYGFLPVVELMMDNKYCQ